MEQRVFDCEQYAVVVTAGDTLEVKIHENSVHTVFSISIWDYYVDWYEALLEKALCHYIEFKDAVRISEWVAVVYAGES